MLKAWAKTGGAGAGRQFLMDVIGLVADLADHHGQEFPPRRPEAERGGAVVPDRLVHAGQGVVGDHREHVVFDVVVHVPVDEPHRRRQQDGAAVQAVVEDVFGKARVLGQADDEQEPHAIGAGQADEHRRQD